MLKMKIVILLIIIGIITASGAQANDQSELTGNINFLYGLKNLRHKEAGIEIELKQPKTSKGIIVGLSNSFDEDEVGNASFAAETAEYYVGGKTTHKVSEKTHLYISGGLAVVDTKLIVESYGYVTADSANILGVWLGSGVYINMTEHLNVGFNIRHSSVNVELLGRRLPAGGTHYGLSIGYQF